MDIMIGDKNKPEVYTPSPQPQRPRFHYSFCLLTLYAVTDRMNAGESGLEQRESMCLKGDLCRGSVEGYVNHS